MAGHLQRVQYAWDLGRHLVFDRHVRRGWDRARVIEAIEFFYHWLSDATAQAVAVRSGAPSGPCRSCQPRGLTNKPPTVAA